MAREKIYLINELPHIYELQDMMEFCRNEKYKKLYIYGKGGKGYRIKHARYN